MTNYNYYISNLQKLQNALHSPKGSGYNFDAQILRSSEAPFSWGISQEIKGISSNLHPKNRKYLGNLLFRQHQVVPIQCVKKYFAPPWEQATFAIYPHKLFESSSRKSFLSSLLLFSNLNPLYSDQIPPFNFAVSYLSSTYISNFH